MSRQVAGAKATFRTWILVRDKVNFDSLPEFLGVDSPLFATIVRFKKTVVFTRVLEGF